ncbi:MAG: fibronectin type III domain-containing protein [Methanomassiliicoccus sp.]|nr:MAG: fibronectin type III domain-containing protein [Methanomassiliicoccus sp.]
MSVRSLLLFCLVMTLSLSLAVPCLQAVPASPGELQAEIGRDYVDLWWQPSGNATNYIVYQGTGADDMAPIANVTAPITAYHDGGLEDGTTRIYYVIAVNEEGESGPGMSIVATVPAKESNELLLPVLAIVLSIIAIQVCVVMLLYHFKTKMRL